MKSKNIKLLLLIIFALTLTGCGHIKNENQVIRYAKKEFGSVELIKTEKISNEKITYTLKDKEYQFSYNCTAYMEDFSMDGSTFFTYPSITCDFESKYKKEIYTMIKNDNSVLKHNLIIELPNSSQNKYDNGSEKIESFYISTTNLADKNIYMPILEKLNKIDHRKYFGKFALEIFDKNTKEKIGVITSKDNKLQTITEEHDKWLLDYVNKNFSTNGQTNSGEIEFIKKEENVFIKDKKEIYEGLLSSNIVGLQDELETAQTTIYYFYDNVAKIDFYIIDYYVFGQACYFNNYSADIRNSNSLCKE